MDRQIPQKIYWSNMHLTTNALLLYTKRIRVIGNTMNVGLKKARGKYIGIVESDDFVEKDMFEKLYKAAEKSDAEIVKSNFYLFNDILQTNKFNENLKDCLYGQVFIPRKETKVFFVSPAIWSCLYKREFLMKHDILFHETPGASYQDTSFAFKSLVTAERVYLLQDAFVHYRINTPSSSMARIHDPSKFFIIFDEFLTIKKFIMERKEKEVVTIYERIKFVVYKMFYDQLDIQFQYAFYLRMLDEFKCEQTDGWLKEREWPEEEWKNLQRLLEESIQWFKETAKVYKEGRLNLFQKTNRKFYYDGFLQYLREQKAVFIYGSGKIGKKVCKHLMERNVAVDNFVVTSKKNNTEAVLGISVVSIDDLRSYAREFPVIVAVRERDQ